MRKASTEFTTASSSRTEFISTWTFTSLSMALKRLSLEVSNQSSEHAKHTPAASDIAF